MKRMTFAALALAGCAAAPAPARTPAPPLPDRDAATRAIARVLDDFHDAAAHADEARYFAHFAADGVFLGTDATERWDVAAFRAYAHPHFAKGKAWSFHATRRAIALSADARVAWFDEDLATERLGPARGSGALALVAGEWKIEQYDLSVVVPNDRFAAVRAAIDAPSLDAVFETSHARALAAAKSGDLRGAERELRAFIVAAESGEAVDIRAIEVHRAIAWLRWAEGDLAGAWAELEASESAHLHSPAMGNMSVTLHARALEERALLLREMAEAAPPTLRAEALAAANAARAEHAKNAATVGQDKTPVVDALFAVRAGDGPGALAAARRIDERSDANAIDLWVLALAYDAGGDHARADEMRAKIRGDTEDVVALAVADRMRRKP